MSVGASPNLYNILNVILSDVAPHSMSELYSISFTDGTSSVSSGTISLSSFQNKTIDTGGSGGGGSEVLLVSKGLTGSQGYTMNTIVPNKDMYQTSGRAIPSGYNPSSGSLTPSGNRYYWNDWNGDWFDGWGDFYIYNPSTTSASYISFANINGSDGTVYTETQTHHSKTFIIKHGWVAQGIFKLDVECSDISFQFSIGAYGNMGSDGSTQNTDIQYAASWGPLSYNYNSQSGTNEWFYSHCIPKVKTFNDGITLSSGNFTSKFRTSISGSDNLALWTDTLRVGATFYFVKGSNSSSGAMYEWVANDIVISGNLTPAIYPQILPSIDPQSEWDGTFDYRYRYSDSNFHYYGLHYINGAFYGNNSDYDIKVNIATNTWYDSGGNHPTSVDELNDGTVFLYSADWPNLYKFTKPTIDNSSSSPVVLYPQTLSSIDPQSAWDGTFDYLYRSSDSNYHYYGLHYIDGDFYSNNSDYDIKVDIATNTWSDEGGNHPTSVDELNDGTVFLYSADWPNLYKFTKPTSQ